MVEKQAGKELAEIKERKLLLAKETAEAQRSAVKEAAEDHKRRLELEKANQIVLIKEQTALNALDK